MQLKISIRVMQCQQSTMLEMQSQIGLISTAGIEFVTGIEYLTISGLSRHVVVSAYPSPPLVHRLLCL